MKKYWQILEFDRIIDEVNCLCRLDNNKKSLDDIALPTDLEEIRHYLDIVDEASVLISRFQQFPLYFKSNIAFILNKTTKHGVLSVEELLEVSKFLDTTRDILNYDETLDGMLIEHNLIKEKIDGLVYLKDLNLRVKEIINAFGEILDSASYNLKDIRKKIRETEKNIQTKLREILSTHASKLTQSVISIRNDRYVIPVRVDYKNTIKGIIHDQSASGETVFIEPQIIFELNNRLNNLREDEKNEIYEILREISLRLADNSDISLNNLNIIIDLDLIYAKANYSIKINGNKININDRGIVELINCHHPLLKVEKIISNNIIIGKDYQGIIITGPNTGGKTVLLKTIGLISLMVKYGLLVPCDEESNIMIFDEVYADIGDEQSIAQNLSTFSSHLKNVIDIMNNVTYHSLVLLDELGSGTDPVEGSSLAIAIFDELISKKCLVIATSHYSELKVHAFNSSNIINASVEFDIKTLKPTYKLLLGVPGQSNAFHISKILGLDEKIINRAKEYKYQNSDELDISLRKLINQTQEMEKKIKQINEKKVLLNEKIQEADKNIEEIHSERNRILKEAETEAKKIIEKTNKRIENVLEELEEMKLREVKLHELSNVKHKIKQIKEEANIQETFAPVDEELKVNDLVFVQNYGCSGIIIKELKNNKYSVQMGNALISIDKNNLRKMTKEVNKPIVHKSTNTVISPKKNVKMSLDLRGARYEEANDMIDKYLDDAIYAGLNQVSIIHGFGTGVIRELVQKKLRSNKNIESFRYGGNGEGGLGATIVTLKK